VFISLLVVSKKCQFRRRVYRQILSALILLVNQKGNIFLKCILYSTNNQCNIYPKTALSIYDENSEEKKIVQKNYSFNHAST